MSEDWADAKAREWLGDHGLTRPPVSSSRRQDTTMLALEASLTALLREVRHDTDAEVQHAADASGYCRECRRGVLVEVRRVVEQVRDVRGHMSGHARRWAVCEEILARLGAL